ncbi:pro-opiomelanocortin-like [Boleophthalmus pectinirostris]|uniref:pro-opiomelanocortin-like n=1 Tax=Boleophthalmus pectinirostris TaxID=150288 RepID=UPI000A1C63E5|nr:pro-opiomelanocortin-like [Boleophthalmus pectinirostris]
MLSLSWLLVAVLAHVCHSSRGSECWESSICANLSNKQRILECIQVCMSELHSESPQSADVDDADAPLGLQNDLTSEDRTLKAVRTDSRSNERRSYSMEHFRWGKPSGRKRRPVKVFASSLEGGGSTEGVSPLQAQRRHLRAYEKRNGDAQEGLRTKSSYTTYSQQERKDGTYRMSHFRWGSPPATKRNGNFMKQWQEEKPQSPLTKLLRNFMGKDVERMVR